MKPTPGQPYTTKTGDTLELISTRAYGYSSKSSDIAAVNASQVNLTPSAEIPTGAEILIPVDNQVDQLRKAQLQKGLR